ncbi:protein translocase subunit SecF [Myxococcota bacterium]|nr:protein translocase subunit SecF [Myxococcota bacterium]MBU1537554.1 protein translocase subunit SecF [Myxococcota bacterium]
MGKRKKFYILSLTLIAISLITLVLNAFVIPGRKQMLNYGIDFMGGTQIQVEFDRKIPASNVRKAMSKLGYADFDVVQFGGVNSYQIRMRDFSSLSEAKKTLIKDTFLKAYSTDFFRVRFSESGDHLKVRFYKPVEIAAFNAIFGKLGIKATLPTVELSQEAIEYQAKLKKGEKPKWGKAHPYTLDYKEGAGISPQRNEYTITLDSISEKLEKDLRVQLNLPSAEENPKACNILSVESRGPQVGKRLRINGILSILYALGFILIYIVLRFDLKFAPGAVIALIHDVIITVGIFAIFYLEFSLPILAALLTIVGYSLNDTIVIYDRIRENIIKLRSGSLSKVINQSLNETFSRTLLTSVTTFLAVFAIFVVSEGVLQKFALAMGIGVIIGTYSSIFVASPMVIWFSERFDLISAKASGRASEVEPMEMDQEERAAVSKESASEEAPELSEEEQQERAVKKAKAQKRKPKGGRGGNRGRAKKKK